MDIKYQKTKTLLTKSNNNSSDCISPNFIYGCLGGCMKSYCYVGRYNYDKLYINTNWEDIFKSILDWRNKQPLIKIPNQQSETQYCVDIGCNSDIALHQKHLLKAHKDGLVHILNWFNSTKDLQLTFATKYSNMLKLDVNYLNRKPRVRISIMPQEFSSILEPNTTLIKERIIDYDRLTELGWQVHWNFSPLILDKKSPELYKRLFENISKSKYKYLMKSEVICLTNHKNTMNRVTGKIKDILQESNEIKNSRGVMRYPLTRKTKALQQFKKLHSKYIGDTIRYIF